MRGHYNYFYIKFFYNKEEAAASKKKKEKGRLTVFEIIDPFGLSLYLLKLKIEIENTVTK